MKFLNQQDPQVAELLKKETQRQQDGLVMIASENIASPAVLEAMSSPIQNKYAEGYPGKRYYTGTQFVDQIEQLAIDRAKELFSAEHVNVQPHSGSTANAGAYFATLKPGDKIMGLDLTHGGHLTHGSKVNFSGQTYNFIHYGVDQATERINMEAVREVAMKEKPKMIVCGATAYPRAIDFKAFKAIADEVHAYLLADISHIVGLCLAGVHENPTPYADIVTTTTHKTLRGPRSAIIVSKNEDRLKDLYWADSKKNLAQRIDSAIFPGLQGGPLEHVIAAKAVCFKEAMSEEFRQTQIQTKINAEVLAQVLQTGGLRLISGGTDNHLMLADCTSLNTTGKEAANWLAEAGLYCNFNTIPFETRSPFDPSGIRIGTPTLSSRGMKDEEMKIVGELIIEMLKNMNSQDILSKSKKTIAELTGRFPIYQELE